jgi:hypothetical protein
MNTKSRIQFILLTAALLSWPLLISQKEIGSLISPNNSHVGSSIAFYLKTLSLLVGGFLASVLLIENKKKNNWQLWVFRSALAVFIAGTAFILKVSLDFMKDF